MRSASGLTFAVWYVSNECWKHFNFGILVSLRTETLVELVQQQAGHLVECIVIEVQFSGQFFDLFERRRGSSIRRWCPLVLLAKQLKQTNFAL